MLYPKDTEKWKQFTTSIGDNILKATLCCIPKILKNESNSQPWDKFISKDGSCVVSQRYWKMKAIHNCSYRVNFYFLVVLYPKDTEKWKQFTTHCTDLINLARLCCIPKILKNESNSQHLRKFWERYFSCVVSQRYWKMKAIHNNENRMG